MTGSILALSTATIGGQIPLAVNSNAPITATIATLLARSQT
jgi:hypothetical protein